MDDRAEAVLHITHKQRRCVASQLADAAESAYAHAQVRMGLCYSQLADAAEVACVHAQVRMGLCYSLHTLCATHACR